METLVTEVQRDVRNRAGWAIAGGIGLIIAGIVALLAPVVGAAAATLIFGWVALAAGILEVGTAWRTRAEKGAFWRFLLAAAYIVVGLYVLARPTQSMMALAFAFGVGLIVRGVFLAFLSFELRGLHRWGWVLFDGIVSALLGVLVLRGWPERSVIYLGIYVGVSMLMNGIDRVVVAGEVRRHVPPPTKAPPIGAAHA